jgi:maleamate amidohydrolase
VNVRPWTNLISPVEIEVYRRAGYQTTYGLGTRPALLIVDVEYNFTGLPGQEHLQSISMYRNSCGPMAWKSIPHTARLLGIARLMGLPIAFTHGFERPDTIRSPRVGTHIVDEIAPRGGELVIEKEAASAFFGTRLAANLVRWGVDTILHTGCVTSGCVRASVVDGAALGYKNAIVEECVFDRALTPHVANLFDMDAKYGDVMALADVEQYLASLPARKAQATSKRAARVSAHLEPAIPVGGHPQHA